MIRFFRNMNRQWTDREHRLLFVEKSGYEDVLARAEEVGGRLTAEDDPLQKARDDMDEFSAQLTELQEKKVGWGEWILKGLSSKGVRESRIEKRISELAEERLMQEAKKTEIDIRALRMTTQYKELLVSAEQAIIGDLRSHNKRKLEELDLERNRLNRWIGKLKGETMPKEDAKMEAHLKGIRERLEKKARGKEGIPQEWVRSRQMEATMRQQFLRLGIAKDGAELNELFNGHLAGEETLLRAIKTNEKLLKKPALQRVLMRELKMLRKHAGYKILEATEGDINIRSVEDQVKHLNERAFPGYQIALNVRGEKIPAFVLYREAAKDEKGGQEQVIVLRNANNPNDYFVIPLEGANKGKVLCRRTPGKDLVEYDLHDERYSMLLNPSGSQSSYEQKAA